MRGKNLLENYVKRLEDLEHIANSFRGVSNSYAIQAGRELRVIVESEVITDEEATLLSRDIVKKIEEMLTFPGPDQSHGDSRNPGSGICE